MLTFDTIREITKKDKYSAFELAKAGFIKNNKGNPNDYNFILKEIKRERLRAVNMNEKGENPAYQITAQAIVDYLQSFK